MKNRSNINGEEILKKMDCERRKNVSQKKGAAEEHQERTWHIHTNKNYSKRSGHASGKKDIL